MKRKRKDGSVKGEKVWICPVFSIHSVKIVQLGPFFWALLSLFTLLQHHNSLFLARSPADYRIFAFSADVSV